jgi:hypothetical protein
LPCSQGNFSAASYCLYIHNAQNDEQKAQAQQNIFVGHKEGFRFIGARQEREATRQNLKDDIFTNPVAQRRRVQ